jgi:large subunit ribosomal protein L30
MSKAVITLRQTGSPIRRHHGQRETLIGLGLNRIGRVAQVPDSPESRGMIAKVKHLVRLEAQLKIYGDTNTLPGNIGYASQQELKALKQLWSDKRLIWFSSHLVRHEAMNTKDESKRSRLVGEHEERKLIPKDEKIVGFNAQTIQYGGFIGFSLISDVQDEKLRAELMERGLAQRDAEHITQAVCNNSDVFLTRDVKSIIGPHRKWLEKRFPTLKVLLPSELATELTAGTLPKANLGTDGVDPQL